MPLNAMSEDYDDAFNVRLETAGVLFAFTPSFRMLGHVCLIHLSDATDEITTRCYITLGFCKL